MGRSPVLETGAGEVGHHLVASGTPYVDLVVDKAAPRIGERSRVVDLVPDDVGLDERHLCQLLCAVAVAGEEPSSPQQGGSRLIHEGGERRVALRLRSPHGPTPVMVTPSTTRVGAERLP